MPGRNTVLVTGEIYHIFNRGVEHRQIFKDIYDYKRATETFKFYQHDTELRFSHVKNLQSEIRQRVMDDIFKLPKIVDIISDSLMPNHFHFLLKQLKEHGISNFLSKFTNSYTKYFNTKEERDGSLLGGTFKSVHIDNMEQLLHVSRYININPTVSCLVRPEDLEKYSWCSFGNIIKNPTQLQKEVILSQFKDIKDYKDFVMNQTEYKKSLENIEDKLIDNQV